MEKHKKTPKTPVKYQCELCDFTSHHKTMYERHIKTDKHKRRKEAQKADLKYRCKLCNFYTNDKSKFDRHLNTKKHKTNQQQSHLTDQTNISMDVNPVVVQDDPKTVEDCNPVGAKPIMSEQQFQERLVKTLKHLLPELAITNNITNNTNSHNRISNNQINIFLNEKCADAISIQEFAKQLAFTIDDVLMKKHDALVSVINKNLDPLAVTERPVHCTNVVRRKWHVKDETEGWKNDNGSTLVREVNNSLLSKSPLQYTETFPNWMEVPKRKDEFVKILQMTSSDIEPKAEARVLSEVSNSTMLDVSKENE